MCFSWGEGCDLFCVALGFYLGVGLVLFVVWFGLFIYLIHILLFQLKWLKSPVKILWFTLFKTYLVFFIFFFVFLISLLTEECNSVNKAIPAPA